MAIRISVFPSDFSCELGECPPGLFLFKKTLGFKSEYGDCECFVVENGEYFWGGTSSVEEKENLQVIPCDYRIEKEPSR